MALVRAMEGLIPGQMAHLATIASRGLTQVIGDMSTCGNIETCWYVQCCSITNRRGLTQVIGDGFIETC